MGARRLCAGDFFQRRLDELIEDAASMLIELALDQVAGFSVPSAWLGSSRRHPLFLTML